MRERTFILIKPDTIQRGIFGSIMSDIEFKGFKLIALKSLKLNDEQFYFLYSDISEKPFHNQFKGLMQCGPSILLVLEGHKAVQNAYNLCGKYKSPEDDPTRSLRQKYSLWTGADVVHRADTPEIAKIQIEFFFKPEELIEYSSALEKFNSQESWDEHHK